MRKLSYVLFAGLVVSLMGGISAKAGPIVGSEAIGGAVAPVPAGTTLVTATSFNLSIIGTGGTGDYSSFPALFASLGSATLDPTNLGSFTFGTAAFGTFTATSGLETSSTAISRVFSITGNFTPGTGFPSSLTTNTASIVITLSQSAPTAAIGLGGSFNTPSLASIPEPASMAMTGIGLSLIGLFHRLRKRSGK